VFGAVVAEPALAEIGVKARAPPNYSTLSTANTAQSAPGEFATALRYFLPEAAERSGR
jgi:hypothetical protein